MQQQRLFNNSSVNSTCFGQLFCPSLGALDPRCCRPVAGRQHRGCIKPQAVTHSLVLLKMGKIIARNVLT